MDPNITKVIGECPGGPLASRLTAGVGALAHISLARSSPVFVIAIEPFALLRRPYTMSAAE